MIMTDAYYSSEQILSKVLGPFRATGNLRIRIESHPLDARFRGKDLATLVKRMKPKTLIYGAGRKLNKLHEAVEFRRIRPFEPIVVEYSKEQEPNALVSTVLLQRRPARRPAKGTGGTGATDTKPDQYCPNPSFLPPKVEHVE